jgi:hypothetical protein
MVSNPGPFTCVVCEWSESHKKSQLYPRNEIYNHFKTSRHLQNWNTWCNYCQEQRLTDDYIEDWLQQHQLLTLHRSAIADAGGAR